MEFSFGLLSYIPHLYTRSPDGHIYLSTDGIDIHRTHTTPHHNHHRFPFTSTTDRPTDPLLYIQTCVFFLLLLSISTGIALAATRPGIWSVENHVYFPSLVFRPVFVPVVMGRVVAWL
ncbi:hypothetical protein QBC39DRAFT_336716 [Podospora conica]|nr:hypothetical protein QBC39DRAFT_336716 [Schizothecium conicum]